MAYEEVFLFLMLRNAILLEKGSRATFTPFIVKVDEDLTYSALE